MKLNIQMFATSKSTKFEESNISVENNTSSLKISIEFSANNSKTYFSNETLYCTCNETTKSKKVSLSKGGKVSASFTFDDIAHNSDGSKSVSWSWNCNTGTAVLGNISDSGTKALTTIPRASTPTFSSESVTLFNTVTITTNRAVNTFTHTLSYSIGSASGTIATNVGESTTWTAPFNLAQQIPNSMTGECTIICTTYDGDTLIGTTNTPLTLVIPGTIKPSITINNITEKDTTMLSKNWGVFVQNKSKLHIPIEAEGELGSTVTSAYVTINGINYYCTYDDDNDVWIYDTDYIQASGSITITATVTDTRGQTNYDTETISVVNYDNPNIEIAQVQRCLYDGTLSDNGTYLLIDFKGTISSVSNNNTALYRIGYKKTTDLVYTYLTLGSNYTINLEDEVSTFTISPDYEYDIVLEATDEFMTASIDRLIDTGFDLLNFNASGKSMAIGKVSSATALQELLEVGLETEFTKDITAQDITANDLDVNDVSAGDITCDSVDSTTGSFDSIDISDGTCNLSTLTINNEAIITIDSFEDYTGAIASGSNGSITYDVTKTDYTPIGIIGVYCDGTRPSYINIFRSYVSGNDAYIDFKNIHPSSALGSDTSITIYVAYIRS